MRKLTFIILFALQFLIGHANEITIPNNYKVKGTFSGELSDTDSFHLIVAQDKSKRDYEVFIYKMTNNDIVKKLNVISYEKQPSILSFHKKNENLVLIISFESNKKKYFNVVDINLTTGDFKKSSNILNRDNKATFRNKENTIIVVANKDEMVAKIINSSDDIKSVKANGDIYDKKLFNTFLNPSLDEINQNEYVIKGSILDIKAYHNNNVLVFSNDTREIEDISRRMFTDVLKFDLNTSNITKARYKGSLLKKINDENSYIIDNLLVQITTNKKEAYLDIYDLNSAKLLNKINLLNIDLSNAKKGDSFTTIEEFLKKSNKKAYKTTITLNKTNSNNYLVRIDYVDATYGYNYNWWWWHHHQFMMNQHNMMMQNMQPRFKPHDFSSYFHYKPIEDNTDNSFQILINSDGSVLPYEKQKTNYPILDKKKYVDELNDDKSLKHNSSCFVKDNFRYIYYNKKSKSFNIINKKIND